MVFLWPGFPIFFGSFGPQTTQAKGNHRDNPPSFPVVTFNLGGLGGGFRPPRPKGTKEKMGGGVSTQIFPQSSPQRPWGKKGQDCFLSKLPVKKFWKNLGWWPHFPYGFPLAWPPKKIFGSFGPQATQARGKKPQGRLRGFQASMLSPWRGFLPIHIGNLRFQVTQAKGDDGENGGFQPRFFPRALPKELGEVDIVFYPKLPVKRFGENLAGQMTPFSLWFSFGPASQENLGVLGPKPPRPEERNHREDWGVFKPACCCPKLLGGSSGENLGCNPPPPFPCGYLSKGNHGESGGFFHPDCSPELPKELREKRGNCFVSKILRGELWGKSGLKTPFPLWFSFGLASQ